MGKTKELPQVDKNVTQKKEERWDLCGTGFLIYGINKQSNSLWRINLNPLHLGAK